MNRMALLATLLTASQVGLTAECITVGSDGTASAPPPPKPPEIIAVSGAVCGSAFIGIYSHFELLDKAELKLFDNANHIVARTPTDSKGRFKFARLPVGKYRAYLEGFEATEEIIEVTAASQRKCQQPLVVKLNVGGECTPPSHVRVAPSSKH